MGRAFGEGRTITTDSREIAAQASAGEPAAVGALQIYSDRLARGLASVLNIVDPDVVVLGGGLSNVTALYELVAPTAPAIRLFGPSKYSYSSSSGAAWRQ